MNQMKKLARGIVFTLRSALLEMPGVVPACAVCAAGLCFFIRYLFMASPVFFGAFLMFLAAAVIAGFKS